MARVAANDTAMGGESLLPAPPPPPVLQREIQVEPSPSVVADTRPSAEQSLAENNDRVSTSAPSPALFVTPPASESGAAHKRPTSLGSEVATGALATAGMATAAATATAQNSRDEPPTLGASHTSSDSISPRLSSKRPRVDEEISTNLPTNSSSRHYVLSPSSNSLKLRFRLEPSDRQSSKAADASTENNQRPAGGRGSATAMATSESADDSREDGELAGDDAWEDFCFICAGRRRFVAREAARASCSDAGGLQKAATRRLALSAVARAARASSIDSATFPPAKSEWRICRTIGVAARVSTWSQSGRRSIICRMRRSSIAPKFFSPASKRRRTSTCFDASKRFSRRLLTTAAAAAAAAAAVTATALAAPNRHKIYLQSRLASRLATTQKSHTFSPISTRFFNRVRSIFWFVFVERRAHRIQMTQLCAHLQPHSNVAMAGRLIYTNYADAVRTHLPAYIKSTWLYVNLYVRCQFFWRHTKIVRLAENRGKKASSAAAITTTLGAPVS